jgi:hypothetical protein
MSLISTRWLLGTLCAVALTATACADGEASTAGTSTPAGTVAVTAAPTTVAPTTTIPATTVPPTTAAPTTTVDPAVESDAKTLFTGVNFTSTQREAFAEAVQASSVSVDSVDVLDFTVDEATKTATLVIAVSSGYNGIEYRDEVAWDIVRPLSTFWDRIDGPFRNDAGTIRTGMNLMVDTTNYIVSWDLLNGIADMRVTSTDFLNQSRQ